MSDNLDEPAADAGKSAAPSIPNGPEIRAHADDALFGPAPLNTTSEGSARRASLLFKRLLGYGLYAVAVACLAGVAWFAGLYFSGDQPSHFAGKLWNLWPVGPQEGAGRTEAARTIEKMAEEIRAIKAEVEAMHATQSARAQDTAALEGLSTQLNQTKSEANAAIAELAARVEKLERESAAKLGQIYERLDRIEHPTAAPTAASLGAAPAESGATAAKTRARGKRHDAFDPSQNPTAPGIPRPLGSRGN